MIIKSRLSQWILSCLLIVFTGPAFSEPIPEVSPAPAQAVQAPFSQQSEKKETPLSKIYVSTLKGDIINPIISKHISRSILQAKKEGAVCFVIELDTPGGLLESTREIVKDILNSPLPVIVYVSPPGARATSAGVFITSAAHIAVMAPSTHIGAAHPVSVGTPFSPGEKKENTNSPSKDSNPGGIPDGDILSEKIMQDTLAWMATIGETRGRNVKWLKEAVTQSSSVTEEEALKLGVIDFIAKDLDTLLDEIDGAKMEIGSQKITLQTRHREIKHLELSRIEQFLNVVANPNIAYILMMLGMIGLIFELTHPGVIFPGVTGMICLLLAFYSFNTLPVNYTGFLLILFAVVLFIAEIFTPSFGILGFAGLISFVFGSMMLVESGYPFLKISLYLIFPTAIVFGSLFFFISYKVLSLHRRKPSTGREGLIGKTAIAETALTPAGKVYIHGELWNAVAVDDRSIPKGEKTVVVEIEGLTLKVKQNTAEK